MRRAPRVAAARTTASTSCSSLRLSRLSCTRPQNLSQTAGKTSKSCQAGKMESDRKRVEVLRGSQQGFSAGVLSRGSRLPHLDAISCEPRHCEGPQHGLLLLDGQDSDDALLLGFARGLREVDGGHAILVAELFDALEERPLRLREVDRGLGKLFSERCQGFLPSLGKVHVPNHRIAFSAIVVSQVDYALAVVHVLQRLSTARILVGAQAQVRKEPLQRFHIRNCRRERKGASWRLGVFGGYSSCAVSTCCGRLHGLSSAKLPRTASHAVWQRPFSGAVQSVRSQGDERDGLLSRGRPSGSRELDFLAQLTIRQHTARDGRGSRQLLVRITRARRQRTSSARTCAVDSTKMYPAYGRLCWRRIRHELALS
eukprot:scaffold1320_cov253-Pinguiococcus_pyrenoidosus.AAC.19